MGRDRITRKPMALRCRADLREAGFVAGGVGRKQSECCEKLRLPSTREEPMSKEAPGQKKCECRCRDKLSAKHYTLTYQCCQGQRRAKSGWFRSRKPTCWKDSVGSCVESVVRDAVCRMMRRIDKWVNQSQSKQKCRQWS